MVFRAFAVAADPLHIAALLHRQFLPAFSQLGHLLGCVQTGLDALGQLHLLLGVEECDLADLLEVCAHRVRRGRQFGVLAGLAQSLGLLLVPDEVPGGFVLLGGLGYLFVADGGNGRRCGIAGDILEIVDHDLVSDIDIGLDGQIGRDLIEQDRSPAGPGSLLGAGRCRIRRRGLGWCSLGRFEGCGPGGPGGLCCGLGGPGRCDLGGLGRLRGGGFDGFRGFGGFGGGPGGALGRGGLGASRRWFGRHPSRCRPRCFRARLDGRFRGFGGCRFGRAFGRCRFPDGLGGFGGFGRCCFLGRLRLLGGCCPGRLGGPARGRFGGALGGRRFG